MALSRKKNSGQDKPVSGQRSLGFSSRPSKRFAGCDLGKSGIKLVVMSILKDGTPIIEDTRHLEHHGKPIESFNALYRDAQISNCAALGTTGLYAKEFGDPLLWGLPEDVCIEAALPSMRSPSLADLSISSIWELEGIQSLAASAMAIYTF